MGFEVSYRTTRPLTPTEADSVNQAADAACVGRTWLSCEPIWLIRDEDGHLVGGSKPNFRPHPDDIADAARQGLTDGTIRDVIDILCRLSRDHGVDWEIDHDYSDGPIGYIRAGVCDDEVLMQIETISDIVNVMGEKNIGLDDD